MRLLDADAEEAFGVGGERIDEGHEVAEAEAIRLAKRVSQRAGEGSNEKAINILKRVLELMPSGVRLV